MLIKKGEGLAKRTISEHYTHFGYFKDYGGNNSLSFDFRDYREQLRIEYYPTFEDQMEKRVISNV